VAGSRNGVGASPGSATSGSCVAGGLAAPPGAGSAPERSDRSNRVMDGIVADPCDGGVHACSGTVKGAVRRHPDRVVRYATGHREHHANIRARARVKGYPSGHDESRSSIWCRLPPPA